MQFRWPHNVTLALYIFYESVIQGQPCIQELHSKWWNNTLLTSANSALSWTRHGPQHSGPGCPGSCLPSWRATCRSPTHVHWKAHQHHDKIKFHCLITVSVLLYLFVAYNILYFCRLTNINGPLEILCIPKRHPSHRFTRVTTNMVSVLLGWDGSGSVQSVALVSCLGRSAGPTDHGSHAWQPS